MKRARNVINRKKRREVNMNYYGKEQDKDNQKKRGERCTYPEAEGSLKGVIDPPL